MELIPVHFDVFLFAELIQYALIMEPFKNQARYRVVPVNSRGFQRDQIP